MRIFIVSLLILVISSCAIKKTENSHTTGFMEISRRWPSPIIPVCIWNEDEFPKLKGVTSFMKNFATKDYERTEKVRFVDWGKCQDVEAQGKLSEYLKIYFKNVNGKPPSANAAVGHSPNAISASCPKVNGRCNMTIQFPDNISNYNFVIEFLVHELGHSLGLKHEHQRLERKNDPNTCDFVQNQEENSNFTLTPESTFVRYVGAYDLKSVMHYCSKAVTLSDGDIQAINYLYGKIETIKDPQFDQLHDIKFRNNIYKSVSDYGFRGTYIQPHYKGSNLEVRARIRIQNNCGRLALIDKLNFKAPLVTSKEVCPIEDPNDSNKSQIDFEFVENFKIPSTGDYSLGVTCKTGCNIQILDFTIENKN